MHDRLFSKLPDAAAPSTSSQLGALATALFSRQARTKTPATIVSAEALSYTADMLKRIKENRLPNLTAEQANDPQTVREQIYELMNCDPYIKATGQKGRIFRPFDRDNQLELLLNVYEFTSFLVNKQLIARDMFKPLIVWDDGSWRDTIRLLTTLVNKGFAKDFVPYVKTRAISGVKHVVTSFFDRFEYDGQQFDSGKFDRKIFTRRLLEWAKQSRNWEIEKASADVRGERTTGYTEFNEPPQQESIVCEGTPPDGSRFSVCILVSATSQNRPLENQQKRLGRFLAEELDANLVTGGMVNNAGGAAAHSYKRHGGKHWAAFSTYAIAAAENPDGRLSKSADYREYSRNIFERMSGMFAYSAGGGWGTFQEMIKFRILKIVAPQLMADKKLLIDNSYLHESDKYSGGPFWDRAVKLVLKTDKRNRDFSSVTDGDILLTYSNRETKKALTVEAQKWAIRRQPEARQTATPIAAALEPSSLTAT